MASSPCCTAPYPRIPPWVTGGEVYGRDRALREFCEEHGTGYVLAVACSHPIQLNRRLKTRADQALSRVPATGWTRASCGPGSKGDRLYAWAWIVTANPRHHLLVRRNLKDPTDQAYFYCYIPEPRPATLRLLVTVAGMRWPVEEDFQVGKDQFGLDHSQVRLKQGLIPLTVAETRRMLNLRTQTKLPEAILLRWAWWRRRHQARARWFHQRTRLTNEPSLPKP